MSGCWPASVARWAAAWRATGSLDPSRGASNEAPRASAPFRERRQAHQDRVDIAAGLEPEQRAAIIDQVEFGIAAAPDELCLALFLGKGRRHPPPHEDRKSTRPNSSH